MPDPKQIAYPVAPIKNYLGAWLYDSILVTSLLFLASLVYLLPYALNAPVDTTKAEHLSTSAYQTATYKTWIFLVWFGFFAWFWTRSGQTLGLRVWKLRIVHKQGHLISLWQALLRFFVSLLPWVISLFLLSQINQHQWIESDYKYLVLLLGFSNLLWRIWDKESLFFHDRVSDTRIISVKHQLAS